MKWFSFLFCIYYLVLVLSPCTDAHTIEGDATIFYIQKTPTTHCTHADDCNPFCYCGCCGSLTASTIFQLIKIQEKSFLIKERGNFSYPSLFLSQYVNNLLRPPQFA